MRIITSAIPLSLILVSSIVGLAFALPLTTHAVTAAGEAGLSQTDTSATPLTDFEKQALTCRASGQSEALLKVGTATPLDRQVLALGTSPLNDWCVYLKAQLDNPLQSEIEGLNPGFGQCLMRFIQAGDAAGGSIRVYSGYRSNAQQAVLYDAALRKYGSAAVARQWVAPPGGSPHNKGIAADLSFNGVQQILPAACAHNTACAWAHAAVSSLGLTFRLGNEFWHIEPANGGCQVVGAANTQTANATPSSGDTTQTSSGTAPATTASAPATNNSTMQQLIDTVRSVADGTGGGSTDGGITGPGSTQLKNIFGSLFNTILGSFGSTTAQSSGSVLPYGNTGSAANGTTQYLVLSEDGVLLARSSVSAQDAINQASAYYNANVVASSSTGHLSVGTTAASSGGMPESVYQLGNDGSYTLVGNTFAAPADQTGTSGGGGSAGSVNSGMSFVSSFIQTIFGILGNIIGNLGKGTR